MVRTWSAALLTSLALAGGLTSASGASATSDGGVDARVERPNTRILDAPPRVTDRATVVFRFRTDPRKGSRFWCTLDDQPARSCASSYDLRVRPGTHTMKIRAKRDGVWEKRPASVTWTYRPAGS